MNLLKNWFLKLQNQEIKGLEGLFIAENENGEMAREEYVDKIVNELKKEISKLKTLRALCIEEDLLDLDSYDSISRANKIQDSWDALKIIEKLNEKI